MSLRWLGSSLLLIVLAAFKLPMTSLPQTAEEPPTEPKWEYKVVKIEASRCAYEEEMTSALNSAGQRGWELVSYERLVFSFPKDAEGTLLIRPAATGAGRANNPQTADSFQGTITMKMSQAQPPACRLMFKRQVHAAARP